MPTTQATVANEITRVLRAQTDQLADQGAALNAFAVLRDDKVLARAIIGWDGDLKKVAVLEACRELALGLRADAVVLAVDTFLALATETDIETVPPSENPAAREALVAYVLLYARTVLQTLLIYGRDDAGRLYLDEDTSTSVAETFAGPNAGVAGSLIEVFRDVVSNQLPFVTPDKEKVKRAKSQLAELGCSVLLTIDM